MKELRDIYFSMQMTLFPMLEEEKIEFSDWHTTGTALSKVALVLFAPREVPDRGISGGYPAGSHAQITDPVFFAMHQKFSQRDFCQYRHIGYLCTISIIFFKNDLHSPQNDVY